MRVRWAAASLCSKSLAVCEKGPKKRISAVGGEVPVEREKREKTRRARVCVGRVRGARKRVKTVQVRVGWGHIKSGRGECRPPAAAAAGARRQQTHGAAVGGVCGGGEVPLRSKRQQVKPLCVCLCVSLCVSVCVCVEQHVYVAHTVFVHAVCVCVW